MFIVTWNDAKSHIIALACAIYRSSGYRVSIAFTIVRELAHRDTLSSKLEVGKARLNLTETV